MKKVLLVNTNTEKSPYPVPPLGVCMLATTLEKDFVVKVYDGVFDEGVSLPGSVREFQPDFIGFSIRNIDDVVADRTIFYPEKILEDFIDPVRKITPVPIILGGSGFSMFPEELMEMTGADYGITGEGEALLHALFNRLSGGEPVDDIPNLFMKTGKNHRKQTIGAPGIFAGFAEIDRHIDFDPYRRKGVYSIQTKRGCSHGCIYCTYPMIEGKKYRRRMPAEIVDEIEQAADRLGNVTFEFVDSTFNDPVGHAEEICKEILRRKLKVSLRTMGINPRHASVELFDLMVRAGFRQIDATPDSASPLMLKNLRKGFTLEQARKMAILIKKFDLPAMWFFLFAGPGESKDTFLETLDFIDQYVNPDDLVYLNAGMRIYPGTPLQTIALREGVIRKEHSLFYPPVFYFSKDFQKEKADTMIREAARTRLNCLPADQTAPAPEMIKEANALRTAENLEEPMFRTLLGIRRRMIEQVSPDL